jgi:thioredoxin-related protein
LCQVSDLTGFKNLLGLCVWCKFGSDYNKNDMKKGISTLILVLAVLAGQAQTKFFEGTWKEAFAEAKKQDKYLFIDCYTDWCGWCKVADKKTFPDKMVGEVLNSYFISVKVDMEQGEGVSLAQKYRVTGFPSYLMFAPDGSFAKKMFGYIENPAEFAAEVKKSMDDTGRPNYPSKLTDKTAFPEFYSKAFSDKGSEEKRVNPKQEVANEWLAKQKDLFSEEAWSVMYRFPLTKDNAEKFLSSFKSYVKLYGKVEVMEVVGQIAGQKLDVAIESKDQKDLEATLAFVDKYMSEDREDTKAYFKLRFFEGTANWLDYAKTAQILIDKRGLKNDINGVNNYSWTIYENATDEKVLSMAIGWMSNVVKLDPQYMYLDTYAALYYKIGKYDEALTWADKAISIGKKNDEDVEETQGLRKLIKEAKEGK